MSLDDKTVWFPLPLFYDNRIQLEPDSVDLLSLPSPEGEHVIVKSGASVGSVFAVLVFCCICLLAPLEEVGKRELWTIFWGALFGQVGAQVSFANALLYTSPVNITIIAAMTPLAVMLIAALILKEPVTFKKAAGV